MAADPLTRIAEICHDQPPDALSKIADALGYTEQREQERAQREQNLVGLLKRLAQRLHPEDPLRVTATSYLKEQGFFNPLRNAGVRADAPTPRDSRLHQLATNRCTTMRHPDSGEEWTFNIDTLRQFAEAVLDDASGVGEVPRG